MPERCVPPEDYWIEAFALSDEILESPLTATFPNRNYKMSGTWHGVNTERELPATATHYQDMNPHAYGRVLQVVQFDLRRPHNQIYTAYAFNERETLKGLAKAVLYTTSDEDRVGLEEAITKELLKSERDGSVSQDDYQTMLDELRAGAKGDRYVMQRGEV